MFNGCVGVKHEELGIALTVHVAVHAGEVNHVSGDKVLVVAREQSASNGLLLDKFLKLGFLQNRKFGFLQALFADFLRCIRNIFQTVCLFRIAPSDLNTDEVLLGYVEVDYIPL